MARPRLAILSALLSVGVWILTAAPAGAITRAQADRVAERVVAGVKGPVVLFRHPSPLPAGTRIIEAGPGPTSAKRTTVRRTGLRLVGSTRVAGGTLLGRRHLYWADLAPNALFQHPSLLILVDDATGRVITRLPMTWWPLVNGKRPPFLARRSAYLSPRFRVLSRGDRAGLKRSAERAPTLAFAVPRPRAPFAITGPPDLSNDCLVVLGDRVDPIFAGDFTVIDQVAKSLKLRKRNADGAAELDAAIGAFKKESPPCTDVAVWVTAHGYPASGSNYAHPAGGTIPESANAQVALSSSVVTAAGTTEVRQELFDSATLRTIMRKHADVTFKLVVAACFAGRWTELSDVANLRVILAGARSDQMGYAAFQSGGAYVPGSQTNAVLTQSGTAVVNTTVNPTGATVFTNGVARGLAAWSVSEEGRARTGGDLAKALVEAFNDSRRNNFAHVLGWATPVISDLTARPEAVAPPPPPPPPPPGQAGLTGSCALTPFDATEFTYQCSFSRQVTEFGIVVVNGRQVIADLPQSGQTCSIGSLEGGTNNFYKCRLNLAAGQAVRGRLRTSPNPSPGMGCNLYAAESGAQLQKIGACTGP